MPHWKPLSWPVLKSYEGAHLLRVALPLGGIGTGTVSVGGRGELRDWEIMNRPAKGYSTVFTGNDAPFFAVRAKNASGSTRVFARALLGPIDASERHHYEGRPTNHHGLPRFRSCRFDTAYPLAQVTLDDPDSPLAVRLQAFNPLIPGNSEDSGLPVASLAYTLTNRSAEPLDVSVMGALRNFIGRDGYELHPPDWKGDRHPAGARRNRNSRVAIDGFQGVLLTSDGVATDDPAWGSFALLAEAAPDETSVRENGAPTDWSVTLLDLWNDFIADGRLDPRPPLKDDDPLAALCIHRRIEAGATVTFAFHLVWHFPNRRAWKPRDYGHGPDRIGNHYTRRSADALAAAAALLPRIPELEARTVEFVSTFLASDLPAPFKEAALFNLSTLRSQTVFRDETGRVFAWEGVMDENGSCPGNCTHVWNYDLATPHLFADLARSFRDTEFMHATGPDGGMSFRVGLPLATHARANPATAADGQMGCVLKLLREWQLSGDDAFLARLWPSARRALAYAWREGGWDADRDGVMEGPQHNTMDVDYHGPNPQMGFWYLAALRAAARLAERMGDAEFAGICNRLAEQGAEWMDANLHNGEYYEHRVLRPGSHDLDHPLAPDCPEFPSFQLGPGCLIDQLVGQVVADFAGLGPLSDRERQRASLLAVLRHNRRTSFHDHFNPMRSYALGDEEGLMMASWPRGRPAVPFPYFAEVMTGFEYIAAVACLQFGLDDEAVRIVAAIRERHDGQRRNPFSEPECGHHYGRALASWGVVPGWSGFHFSAVERVVGFGPRTGRFFWANGSAWGDYTRRSGREVTLRVLHGTLQADRLVVAGAGTARIPGGSVTAPATLSLTLAP